MAGFSPVRDGSACLLLLLLGLFAAAHSAQNASEVDVKVDLDCTHDYEKISCQLKAQNCSEYSLTLLNNDVKTREDDCPLQLCDSGACCCSIKICLIAGETFTPRVRSQGRKLESKIIDVFETFKPKTPTIVSVNESNGNFEVRWTTNMKDQTKLSAHITFYKKGDPKKVVSKEIQLAKKDGLEFFEINGQHLEPDTTYVVSMRSFSGLSGKFSDSSEEREFKTHPSDNSQLLLLIVGLSVCAVILGTAACGCYVKHKNIRTYSNPKLIVTHLSKPPFIYPEGLYIHSVYVEPLVPDDSKQTLKMLHGSQSPLCTSGNSSGSSKDNYGVTLPPDALDVTAAVLRALGPTSLGQKLLLSTSKDFLKDPYRDSAVSPSLRHTGPPGVGGSQTSSGSSGLFNQTYSMLLPNSAAQKQANGSAAPTQCDALSDSACCSDTSGAADDPGQPSRSFPAGQDASPLVPRDASNQQCRAEALRFLHSDFAGLEMAVLASENPVYGSVPVGPQQLLTVKDDYQPVQCKTEAPDFLISEKQSSGGEQLIRRSGETFQIPQTCFWPFVPGFINNASNGACRPELQLPFLHMMPSDKTIKVISDYQSV